MLKRIAQVLGVVWLRSSCWRAWASRSTSRGRGIAYARMTTDDLGALYEFLHGLAPVDGPTGDAPFRRAD